MPVSAGNLVAVAIVGVEPRTEFVKVGHSGALARVTNSSKTPTVTTVLRYFFSFYGPIYAKLGQFKCNTRRF